MPKKTTRYRSKIERRNALVPVCEAALRALAREGLTMAPTIEPGPFVALDGPACSASYRPSDGLTGRALDEAIDGVVGGIKSILDSEWAGVRGRAALAKILHAETEIAALTENGGNSLVAAARSMLPALRALRERLPRNSNVSEAEQDPMALRTVVIADFDHSDFLGLKRGATLKELAVLSILAGSVPGKADGELSVAEMLRLEEKAMRQARDRLLKGARTITTLRNPVFRDIRCGNCNHAGQIPATPTPADTRYLCSNCGAVLESGARTARADGQGNQPRS